MFISIEGIEGVGKTTLINGLKKHFADQDKEVVLCREPGSTILSEKIRAILLDPNLTGSICPLSELFLFYASRFQNAAENILPALESGTVVISDRWSDSTAAYQGYARGMDVNSILWLNNKFNIAQPDITFWLDAPVEVGLSRALSRSKADRFEQEKYTFFEKVRAGFSELQKLEPARIKQIDATQSQDQVLTQAISILQSFEKAQ